MQFEKGSPETLAVTTSRLNELDDYRALMSVIRNLDESDIKKYAPYISGLAREAMGFKDHKRSISPTKVSGGVLPSDVEIAVQEFFKDRSYSAIRLSQIPQKLSESQVKEGVTLSDLRKKRRAEINARLDFIESRIATSPLLVDYLKKEFSTRSNRDALRRKLSRGAKEFEMSSEEYREDSAAHREQKERIMRLKASLQ